MRSVNTTDNSSIRSLVTLSRLRSATLSSFVDMTQCGWPLRYETWVSKIPATENTLSFSSNAELVLEEESKHVNGARCSPSESSSDVKWQERDVGFVVRAVKRASLVGGARVLIWKIFSRWALVRKRYWRSTTSVGSTMGGVTVIFKKQRTSLTNIYNIHQSGICLPSLKKALGA